MPADNSLYDGLDPATQRAVKVIKLFLDAHNTKDGTGLLAGPPRYEVLEQRLILAATAAGTLTRFWDGLHRRMSCPIPRTELHPAILHALRADDQTPVLVALRAQPQAIIMIARAQHMDDKAARRALRERDQSPDDATPAPTLGALDPNDSLPI